ncbi:unnamed protein product [Bemisia tabaci]|uniref:Amino acid transporter transmembrane domain-containing protein n=2 Tax=Bemisia tabaci TaxID=7038 RepID=A0A9P0G4E3_BEMTA|nr:unnamed protein product [Bemisia tabaci]
MEPSTGEPQATELDTFLPQDGSNKDGSSAKYKVQVLPTRPRDAEAPAGTGHHEKGYWDPFKERKLDHATTDGETLTHLLKASLGTGILAMPAAFKNAGMITGIFATIIVSLVCTHCSYVLVKCAHSLYHRKKVTTMTFADVGEVAFANGPPWGRKFSKWARFSILFGLFLAYFGTCSVYTVIIAKNFKIVIEHHSHYNADIRFYIAVLLVPLILLSWIPNLKYLAPISMLANFLMAGGLGITFWYLVWDLPSVWERPQFASWETLPDFFSTTIFAIEAIGVIMPLENAMETPQHFVGICGVLNRGMSGVTMIYILLGFLGFLKFGDAAQDNITNNLDITQIAPQVANIFVAIAVFCTFGLQFFVCLEIGWDSVKGYFPKRQRFYNYIVRTVLVSGAVFLAIAVPTIGPFINLIGALCFSLLGLIIPVFIEFVTYWDVGFGSFNWIVWKNILVLIFGVLALVFGSATSIKGIAALYAPQGPVADGFNKTLENLSSYNTTSV